MGKTPRVIPSKLNRPVYQFFCHAHGKLVNCKITQDGKVFTEFVEKNLYLLSTRKSICKKLKDKGINCEVR